MQIPALLASVTATHPSQLRGFVNCAVHYRIQGIYLPYWLKHIYGHICWETGSSNISLQEDPFGRQKPPMPCWAESDPFSPVKPNNSIVRSRWPLELPFRVLEFLLLASKFSSPLRKSVFIKKETGERDRYNLAPGRSAVLCSRGFGVPGCAHWTFLARRFFFLFSGIGSLCQAFNGLEAVVESVFGTFSATLMAFGQAHLTF